MRKRELHTEKRGDVSLDKKTLGRHYFLTEKGRRLEAMLGKGGE